MGQNWPDDKKEQIKIENEGVQEERTTVAEEKRGWKERFFEQSVNSVIRVSFDPVLGGWRLSYLFERKT